MAWSRLVLGYIALSLALSQITRGPGVSRLNPTKKGFSAVSWLRKQKPGPSHQGGIPGAQAPVKCSAVRYEDAKELLCGLLSSEAELGGCNEQSSVCGGRCPSGAGSPSSVHEPHTGIRAQRGQILHLCLLLNSKYSLVKNFILAPILPNLLSIFLNDQ